MQYTQAQIIKKYYKRTKIQSEVELNLGSYFIDLENNSDLKADMRELQIVAAIEMDVGNNKKAVVIIIPYRQRKLYYRSQFFLRLIRELEKKFSGKHVVIITKRRMYDKPSHHAHKKRQKRPRSRTLTAVHEALLEDIVFPVDITGKRMRYRLDGSHLMKVHLDKKDQANTEYKLETFAAVYKKLARKLVSFEFYVPPKEI